MGSKEIQQIYIRLRVDRLVIVALPAEPPGVHELCSAFAQAGMSFRRPPVGLGESLFPWANNINVIYDRAAFLVMPYTSCSFNTCYISMVASP